ncbi:MAG: hypothetical protein ACJAZW_000514 [Maritalea sp.]|jgi:hypothetical protein
MCGLHFVHFEKAEELAHFEKAEELAQARGQFLR